MENRFKENKRCTTKYLVYNKQICPVPMKSVNAMTADFGSSDFQWWWFEFSLFFVYIVQHCIAYMYMCTCLLFNLRTRYVPETYWSCYWENLIFIQQYFLWPRGPTMFVNLPRQYFLEGNIGIFNPWPKWKKNKQQCTGAYIEEFF